MVILLQHQNALPVSLKQIYNILKKILNTTKGRLKVFSCRKQTTKEEPNIQQSKEFEEWYDMSFFKVDKIKTKNKITPINPSWCIAVPTRLSIPPDKPVLLPRDNPPPVLMELPKT